MFAIKNVAEDICLKVKQAMCLFLLGKSNCNFKSRSRVGLTEITLEHRLEGESLNYAYLGNSVLRIKMRGDENK